ncbi:hypothetical protein GCM10011346_43700 [Oceanobacillus neutriphilus]|uniref:Uncharacterized protein n=1 Tax=Oceanobacillus neutriphilus TaxID=531815 RepID=A0ABQ2P147_9BACI|nr:hypothetical protein GCM10011346_43700 [Oceanobacillus neutriphilus]
MDLVLYQRKKEISAKKPVRTGLSICSKAKITACTITPDQTGINLVKKIIAQTRLTSSSQIGIRRQEFNKYSKNSGKEINVYLIPKLWKLTNSSFIKNPYLKKIWLR